MHQFFSYQNDVRIFYIILVILIQSSHQYFFKQPMESLCVVPWLHGVYLTSRIDGLDSMMATMILSM